MKSNRSIYTLEQVCSRIYSGGTPSTSHPEYWGGTINWLSSGETGQKYITKTNKKITELGVKQSSTKLAHKHCTVVAAAGQGCTRGQASYLLIDTYVNQSLIVFEPNEKIVLSKYLYFDLDNRYEEFRLLSDGTSTRGGLSGWIVKRMEINLPSIIEQKRIVALLESIDEKIELNNAINHNLQQQAEALFAEWFANKKDGFDDVSLSTLMSYAGGNQPPASEFVFEPKDGYVRFVQIRDYETDGHITYIPISSKNKLCDEKDIMIARYGASLGRICFGINGAYNVALAKVFPKKPYYREFLRCYLSSREFYEGINNRGGRSAQAGFNESDIRSFVLPFPHDEILVREFETIAASMFSHRLNLLKENRKLATLRDTLLPKLMSGEIDVSEVEI